MSDNDGFDLNQLEEAIFVAKYKGRFHWFRCERDYWILDLEKRRDMFLNAGIAYPELGPHLRFGISVVNEATADRFLDERRVFEISKTAIAQELADRARHAQSWWDVSDLFPIMFVDFDRRHACAFYADSVRLERCVPDEWTSEFEDFLTKYSQDDFPLSEKYWIQKELNMLDQLVDRGRRVTP